MLVNLEDLECQRPTSSFSLDTNLVWNWVSMSKGRERRWPEILEHVAPDVIAKAVRPSDRVKGASCGMTLSLLQKNSSLFIS